MCQHQPRCPGALAPDRAAARVQASHPEQGWSLLCNGVVLFDDAGVLLPGGPASRLRPVQGTLAAYSDNHPRPGQARPHGPAPRRTR
jgi:hypothetical protein